MKKGGEFIAEGEDTCVYDPPLACTGQPRTPSGKYVSRVVKVEEGREPETRIQESIRNILKNVEAQHPGKVANYFNLMESSCKAFKIGPTDLWNKKTSKRCTRDPLLQLTGEVTPDAGLENIITPIQGETVVVYRNQTWQLSRSAEKTAAALKNLLIALVYVDGAFIHNDAHGKNLAWMPDGRIVMFDWGRSFLYDTSIATYYINEIINKPNEYEGYSQFMYLIHIVQTTTQDPEVLKNVWDILAIIGLMQTFDIVSIDRIVEVMNDMTARLKVGKINQPDLLALIEQLFMPEDNSGFATPMSEELSSPESSRPVTSRFDFNKRGGAKGGEFVARGVDTCVFIPPLSCKGKPDPPPGEYVSRVVKEEAGESRAQTTFRELVRQAEERFPGRVEKYFNFMSDSCNAFTVKPTDTTNTRTGKQCKHYPQLQKPGEVEPEDGLENLITPIQGATVVMKIGDTNRLSKSRAATAPALKNLMIALACIDGAFIHNDAHGKNIAWMPAGHLVLFDWGRSFVFDPEVAQQKINDMVERSERYSTYTQYQNLVYILKKASPRAYDISNLWDILGIMGLMDVFEIIPEENINRALRRIRAALPNGKMKRGQVISIIEEMFQFSPASSRTESSVESDSTTPRMAEPAVVFNIKNKGVGDRFRILFPGPLPKGGVRQTAKFCRCIKAVRKTIKARPGSTKESGAIAVCNKSILGKKGRTLKKFRCGKKPYLKTQKKLK